MRPASQQDDKLELVRSNDDDVGAAFDIHGLIAGPHKRITLWVIIYQIQHGSMLVVKLTQHMLLI